MPIYEYECPKCGAFEAFQKASDKPLKADPECKHKDCPKCAERLISASTFHLKGGGWYKSDYASSGSSEGGKKKKKSGDSTSTESTSTEKKDSSSSSDTKSAASSDKPSIKKTGTGGCGSGCGCH